MKIFIGNDHSAVDVKNKLVKYIESEFNIQVINIGTNLTESCDYPDIAKNLCDNLIYDNLLYEYEKSFGILICGTGIGMSIAANKITKIRCALCSNNFMAQMAKEHNNANVLSFGSRTTDIESMKSMIKIFIESKFEGGRHKRRINKI